LAENYKMYDEEDTLNDSDFEPDESSGLEEGALGEDGHLDEKEDSSLGFDGEES